MTLHTISLEDRSFAEKELHRINAMGCIFYVLNQKITGSCPKLQLDFDADSKQKVLAAKSLKQIQNSDWQLIQNRKLQDIEAIKSYNSCLTVYACDLFKKPDTFNIFKQILEIKKYLTLLLVAVHAESHKDVELVVRKIGRINILPAALPDAFVYSGAVPSDAFKSADQLRLEFNVHLNKLEQFLMTRYEEKEVCYSWWSRGCKLIIALHGYDAFMMMDIHNKTIELPEHKQGRLGGILGGCEFDLKQHDYTIKYKAI